ncbi:MAG: glycosyltransferase family 2 protein [Terriglobia bacterium]
MTQSKTAGSILTHKASMALVSIVVVNHNGSSLLEDCLQSLGGQTFRDYDVILVDNGSTDDSTTTARRILPEIKVISLGENAGWAKANNIGIRSTQSEYILVLNNDTKAEPDFLFELVQRLESDPEAGMVAPKILNFYDRRLIDSVGGLVICRDGIAQGFGRGEIDSGQHNQLEEALIPSGCAALYRMSMLNEIGLFDESFFAYCEDSDLALRGLWAGWKALAAPHAVVYHKYSATAGSYSPAKMYFVERNHFFVAIRNFPAWMILPIPVWTAYRYALMALAVITKKGKSAALEGVRWQDLFVALLRGTWSAMTGACPRLSRRTSLRRITSRQFAQKLKEYRLPISQMIFKQ